MNLFFWIYRLCSIKSNAPCCYLSSLRSLSSSSWTLFSSRVSPGEGRACPSMSASRDFSSFSCEQLAKISRYCQTSDASLQKKPPRGCAQRPTVLVSRARSCPFPGRVSLNAPASARNGVGPPGMNDGGEKLLFSHHHISSSSSSGEMLPSCLHALSSHTLPDLYCGRCGRSGAPRCSFPHPIQSPAS